MDEEDLGYEETKWNRFLGEAVCARLNRENYHGVVKHISHEQNAVYLQPALVSNAGNKGLHIEHNLPLMVPFDGCVVSPIKEGIEELEAFVRAHNTALGIVDDARDKFKGTGRNEFDFDSMQTKWDVFLGKAVFARFGGDNYYGVVSRLYSDEEGFQPEQNGVYLQPSVVYTVAGNRFGIVSDLPTMVPFNVPLVVPLRGIEELETIVKYYNTSREAIEAQEAAKRQKQ